MKPLLNDASWLRQSFMLPQGTLAISDRDRQHRTYSGADHKYTDTTLGGNFAINNPPQFTRFADVKNKGAHMVSRGMGRYYSEAIDDNSVNVHMRFGVPEYNSVSTFFANFYDPEAGHLARTGETTGLFYTAGKAVGFVVSVPLKPFIWAGRLWRFLTNKPYSKYYYLKPTMHLYWNTVNYLANAVAVNMGLVPSVWADETDAYKTVDNGDGTTSRIKLSDGSRISQAEWETFNRILPDIFRSNGGIDIYQVATRAQRLHDRYQTMVQDIMNNASNDTELRQKFAELHTQQLKASATNATISQYMNSYLESKLAQAPSSAEEQTNEAGNNTGTTGSWESSGLDLLKAELRDGAQWVTFRLDEPGTVSESFSSSTKESAIAETINGISAQAKKARNSVMNFNLSDGIVGNTLEAAIGAVKDFTAGALDGIGLSGLAVLGGGAFADIPKVWDNSTAQLPSADFTIQLRTPYGNKLSVFMNLYIPLLMLLAGALPRSTGRSSYASPFMCELFCPGMTQIRNGMIESISITRGTSNAGWSVDGLPLGIDITFTVVDMSSVMHIPISDNAGLFDDDNAFNDYMAILGGLGVAEQVYPVEKLKRRLNYMYQDFQKWTSPGHAASWFVGTLPGRTMSALAKGSASIS